MQLCHCSNFDPLSSDSKAALLNVRLYLPKAFLVFGDAIPKMRIPYEGVVKGDRIALKIEAIAIADRGNRLY